MGSTVKTGKKRWQAYAGILGMILGIVLAVAVVYFYQDIRKFEQYGYLWAFIISLFGGSTILAPIPMTPVIFALGTVIKPAYAPYLGPVFVGMAAGFGEALGGLTIYWTGWTGRSALANAGNLRIQKIYQWLLGWISRKGSLSLFVLSAVINPFFYPAGLACGALRFGLWRYFLISWAGKTIKGITVAAAGYWGLGSLLRLFGIPV
ncbi:MAG: VTT domain-containing protein [Chloroflexota bacterium]